MVSIGTKDRRLQPSLRKSWTSLFSFGGEEGHVCMKEKKKEEEGEEGRGCMCVCMCVCVLVCMHVHERERYVSRIDRQIHRSSEVRV